MPPQSIHWFDESGFNPHVFAMMGKRDPKTFKRVYVEDPEQKYPMRLFVRGFDYKLFWLIPTNIHLFGIEGARDR